MKFGPTKSHILTTQNLHSVLVDSMFVEMRKLYKLGIKVEIKLGIKIKYPGTRG